MYNIVKIWFGKFTLFVLKLKNYLSFKYVLSEYAASNLIIDLYFVKKIFKTGFSIKYNRFNVCVCRKFKTII